MQKINIALCGTGNVGSSFIDLILQSKEKIKSNYNVELNLNLIGSRKGKINNSDLFKSTICFKSELTSFPKTTLLYNQSIYAAPIITPKLAITATKKLSLNAPIKIKNSPTNPLVPGRPKAANVNNINKTEYLGIILTIPP